MSYCLWHEHNVRVSTYEKHTLLPKLLSLTLSLPVCVCVCVPAASIWCAVVLSGARIAITSTLNAFDVSIG